MEFAEPTNLDRKSGMWGTRPRLSISAICFSTNGFLLNCLINFVAGETTADGHCRSLGFARDDKGEGGSGLRNG
jgi:hypothetical protein